MKQTYETGLRGEDAAAEYLIEHYNMIPLEHRFRTKCGEIDLIMRDGDTIVFVEVKTRKSGLPGSGLSAVNLTKQKRITRAAMLYLMQVHSTRAPVRFDLVEILDGEFLYIPNAFQPYGNFKY